MTEEKFKVGDKVWWQDEWGWQFGFTLPARMGFAYVSACRGPVKPNGDPTIYVRTRYTTIVVDEDKLFLKKPIKKRKYRGMI